MSEKTKKIIAISVSAVLVAALALLGIFLYQSQKPTGETGRKTITVVVRDTIHEDVPEKTVKFKTDSAYLWYALEEQGIAEGVDTQYGKTITTVNGTTADEASYQYWIIYVNDDFAQYGATNQPIADGDIITLSLENCY